MATELLITIHDQDLLLECEASDQFAGLPRTYLFVGPRPVDRIPIGMPMILAREYVPNFEHLPNTYDFSGWWCAARHGLLTADRILTLQYDMIVNDPGIIKRVDELLDANPGPIAFTPGHRLADNWMLLIPGFREVYDAGMHQLGVDQGEWPAFNEWPSTQGMAWHVDEFQAFMMWVEPLFDYWADSVWAGHLMERTVKAWCVTEGTTEQYLPGVITHLGRDSHGTCALMGGNHAAYRERSATFGR